MEASHEPRPRSITTLVDAAADVLDRAERQETLTAAELSDLRRALQEVRRESGRPPANEPRFDPDKLRASVTILSGAASGAAAGAVSGTLIGAATGSLLFPGIGTMAGALIGAKLAAVTAFPRRRT